ncbi:uncharacterized protein LOC110847210 [Folsomia candida]|uniref:MATH domain-containing protein n=1 Tax=Folsomia candida TaxID=158441 RepID=A0A226EKP8_FOLCA|nr:uncharacterized protein LOC110847210 [Folsomia candida]OXA57156.1 hypothetical protein Fcan01_07257 [Folsomia candida]
MASNRITNSNYSPVNSNQQLTKVPNGVQVFKSKIDSQSNTFLWEINGIAAISKQNLWRIPSCEFQVGLSKWKLSLDLGSNGNILLAKPELIHHPTDSTIFYTLRLYVVNPQNYVIHASQFGKGTKSSRLDHPILHDNGHLGTCEVLRFSDGIVDLFSNYVFNDALKFLVEMTVFGNKP